MEIQIEPALMLQQTRQRVLPLYSFPSTSIIIGAARPIPSQTGSLLDAQIFVINAQIAELNVMATLSGVNLDFPNHIHAWALTIGTPMPSTTVYRTSGRNFRAW
jgi:hypothetical protein